MLKSIKNMSAGKLLMVTVIKNVNGMVNMLQKMPMRWKRSVLLRQRMWNVPFALRMKNIR